MKHPPSNIDMTCFNWVKLILKTELPSNAKYLALYLSTYMNSHSDMAYPSLATIEGQTGLAHATVLKWLALLQSEGWLIKVSGNRVESNQYIINVPKEVGHSLTYVNQRDKVGQPLTSNNKPNNKKPSKGTRITDSFEVTSEMMRWVQDNNLGHINIILETDKFIDYNKGKGNVGKDWKATWRNWIRNADKFGKERAGKANGRAAIAAEIRGH